MAILAFIGAIFDLMQIPIVTTLPFVDEYLVTGRGYLEWLMVVFPPFAMMLSGFMFVLGFKIVMVALVRIFRIIR